MLWLSGLLKSKSWTRVFLPFTFHWLSSNFKSDISLSTDPYSKFYGLLEAQMRVYPKRLIYEMKYLLVDGLKIRINLRFPSLFFFHLLVAVSGVCFAETINSILAKRWKSFAGQNYFDTHGLFISALWSGPLLFITAVILVSHFISTLPFSEINNKSVL